MITFLTGLRRIVLTAFLVVWGGTATAVAGSRCLDGEGLNPGGTICQLESLEGCGEEKRIAGARIPPSPVHRPALYLMAGKENLYIQSNVRAPGAWGVTKLHISRNDLVRRTLAELVAVMMTYPDRSESRLERTRSTAAQQYEYVLDRSVVEHDWAAEFVERTELAYASVYGVDEAEWWATDSQKGQWFFPAARAGWFRGSDTIEHPASRVLARPFPARVNVAVLSCPSEVSRAAARRFGSRSTVLPEPSEAALRAVLERFRNSVVIALGTLDGPGLVLAGRTTRSTVGLDRLSELAREQGVVVIPVACHSGSGAKGSARIGRHTASEAMRILDAASGKDAIDLMERLEVESGAGIRVLVGGDQPSDAYLAVDLGRREPRRLPRGIAYTRVWLPLTGPFGVGDWDVEVPQPTAEPEADVAPTEEWVYSQPTPPEAPPEPPAPVESPPDDVASVADCSEGAYCAYVMAFPLLPLAAVWMVRRVAARSPH